MNLLDNLNPIRERELMMTRRQLFGRTALGLGTAAMANMMTPSLLGQNGLGDGAEGTHHKAKAKRVIYLFQSGGPLRWIYLITSLRCKSIRARNCRIPSEKDNV